MVNFHRLCTLRAKTHHDSNINLSFRTLRYFGNMLPLREVNSLQQMPFDFELLKYGKHAMSVAVISGNRSCLFVRQEDNPVEILSCKIMIEFYQKEVLKLILSNLALFDIGLKLLNNRTSTND